jgi:hypothetical protein
LRSVHFLKRTIWWLAQAYIFENKNSKNKTMEKNITDADQLLEAENLLHRVKNAEEKLRATLRSDSIDPAVQQGILLINWHIIFLRERWLRRAQSLDCINWFDKPFSEPLSVFASNKGNIVLAAIKGLSKPIIQQALKDDILRQDNLAKSVLELRVEHILKHMESREGSPFPDTLSDIVSPTVDAIVSFKNHSLVWVLFERMRRMFIERPDALMRTRKSHLISLDFEQIQHQLKWVTETFSAISLVKNFPGLGLLEISPLMNWLIDDKIKIALEAERISYDAFLPALSTFVNWQLELIQISVRENDDLIIGSK